MSKETVEDISTSKDNIFRIQIHNWQTIRYQYPRYQNSQKRKWILKTTQEGRSLQETIPKTKLRKTRTTFQTFLILTWYLKVKTNFIYQSIMLMKEHKSLSNIKTHSKIKVHQKWIWIIYQHFQQQLINLYVPQLDKSLRMISFKFSKINPRNSQECNLYSR